MKKRYLVELTEAQIVFIDFMMKYAEAEIMDGSSFEDGKPVKNWKTDTYEYFGIRKRDANLRDAIREATDKARDNGLKTIKT